MPWVTANDSHLHQPNPLRCTMHDHTFMLFHFSHTSLPWKSRAPVSPHIGLSGFVPQKVTFHLLDPHRKAKRMAATQRCTPVLQSPCSNCCFAPIGKSSQKCVTMGAAVRNKMGGKIKEIAHLGGDSNHQGASSHRQGGQSSSICAAQKSQRARQSALAASAPHLSPDGCFGGRLPCPRRRRKRPPMEEGAGEIRKAS